MSGTEGKHVQLVKVYIRQRPFTQQEIETRHPNIVQQTTEREILIKSGTIEKKYKFDRVFPDTTAQAEVYQIVVSPLIDLILSGYTCTVFAYGQTGTGKTHTMIGQNVAINIDFVHDHLAGMVPRAAVHLFSTLAQLNVEHTVTVSFIEIYNEEVRDLLVKDSAPLKLYDDPDNKGSICVKGLTEKIVADMHELYYLLTIGTIEKHTASTNLNRNSSRSHTIFTIIVHTREATADGEEITKTGKLNLIDLAGSENVGRSGATEMRAREAGTINKSLLTLGKVIKALALKAQHVPYRESKLTRILQDSLGGKSKTCMIATFAPTLNCFDETVSTLDYAYVARSVANCPTVNINRKQTNILKHSHEEIAKLRQELNAIRASDGFYMSASSYEQMTFDIEAKSERVLTLLKQINELEVHIATKQKHYDELNRSYQKVSSTAETIAKKLEHETKKQEENTYVMQYINGQILQTKEVADTLLNVCESSTKHEEIYWKKFENQCHSVLHNASVANNATVATTNSLKGIQDQNQKFVQVDEDLLHCAKPSIVDLTGSHLENLEKMDKLSTEILTDAEGSKLVFDSLFPTVVSVGDKRLEYFEGVHDTQLAGLSRVQNFVKGLQSKMRSDIQSHEEDIARGVMSIDDAFIKHENYVTERDSLFDALLASLRQSEENLQEEMSQNEKLVAHYSGAIESMETKAERMSNEVASIDDSVRNVGIAKELVNENSALVLKSFKDALEQLDKIVRPRDFLQDAADGMQKICTEIDENEKQLNERVEVAKAKTMEDFAEMTKAFADGLHRYNTQIEEMMVSSGDRLKNIKDDVHRTTETHCGNVNNAIEQIVRMKPYQELDISIRNALDRVRGCAKNIDHRVHKGDTPIKPIYNYPKEIDSEIPEMALREQFKNLVS